MALDTYGGLKAEVADWLNRKDLDAKIPTFIRLLESQINRKLRTHQMMQRATADISLDYTALPADFKALYNCVLLTNPITKLEYMTPGDIQELRVTVQGTARKPGAYSIVGSTIEVAPTPDTTYSMEITYWKAIPYLDDVINPTNWVLTQHPDLYLYGTLLQAAPYLNNDERITTWGTAVSAIVDSINVEDERALKGGVPLKARIKPYGG